MSRNSYDSFEEFYQEGNPPWETAAPQPAIVELADRGRFTGRVMDVACGTGENSLLLASRGHAVLGVDGSRTALSRARAKAEQRGSTAEFELADAFDLIGLGRTFDTVLDSAFLHIPGNTAEDRRAYTGQLAQVLRSSGWVHLLQISEHADEHPSLTRAQIVDSFDDDWTTMRIDPARYAATSGEVPAWLVSVQRR